MFIICIALADVFVADSIDPLGPEACDNVLTQSRATSELVVEYLLLRLAAKLLR